MREPDPDLLLRAKQGDVEAFGSIVRDCQADAWRFARSLCRDPALCDDITQEAFLRAYRFLPSFRGDSSFGSWLLSIVRNCANDAMRRASRPRPEVEPRASSDPSLPAEIAAAVAALPPRLRDAFLVVEVYGMPYDEAARLLGTKVGTVKSRVHRARRALVAELTEVEPDAV